MSLLELPDLRHALVDTGTTLLCISGYDGLPCRTIPINLIHETARRSERVDDAVLSSAVWYEIPGQNDGKGPFLWNGVKFFPSLGARFWKAIYVHVLLYFLFKFVGDICYWFVDSEFILVFYFHDQGPSVPAWEKFQAVTVNQSNWSFRHHCTHREDYMMSRRWGLKRIPLSRCRDIRKSTKSKKNWNKAALRQVVHEKTG